MDYKKELEEYILIWEFLNEKSFDKDQFKWTDGKPISNPYKTDWNYLMECILKIQSLEYNVELSYKRTLISPKNEKWCIQGLRDEEKERSIIGAYKAVIEFIEYHNKTITQKDNELIAEFMGFTYRKDSKIWEDTDRLPFLGLFIQEAQHKELLFGKSWDWLLPTVQKILNQDIKEEVRIEIIKYLFSFDFNSLYNEVVQYIKTHK